MAKIAYDHVGKVFDDGTEAVVDFSLDIRDGESMVLVGPSGCGKSTLLRMLAGLEEITTGEITIDGRVINNVSPKERNTAMVFQHYALYPHLKVGENVGFSLKLRRVPRKEREQAVRRGANILRIQQYLKQRPRQLSGGQQQRVAMGRAIVRRPSVFLLDEPLSNLDAKLRVEMRAELIKLREQLQTTTIYVTHDQTEALTMGDRVAVLEKGVLQQVGDPLDVYLRPANLFVAGFIGTPPMNLFAGRVTADGDRATIAFAGQQISIDAEVLADHPALTGLESRPVVIGMRPEHFRRRIVPRGPRDQMVRGTLAFVEHHGDSSLLHVDVESEGRRQTFITTIAPHIEPEVGGEIDVAFDISKLHFFDPDTGAAL